ncbi:hypothetical protein KZ483_23990 [Paenibacillus sp. sptzw28]|uniref:hypothetical protein n=1 Tax=Paenibacillus sp. sptzw28 TaxID=715179 RepID=UPI001C6E7251|nr:hypothetical protein [Paenibacillus sp. sptzw28]QYR20784.1 hypothetical protein KZ483_23990 [Paenibacillus sp. sptzw28]
MYKEEVLKSCVMLTSEYKRLHQMRRYCEARGDREDAKGYLREAIGIDRAINLLAESAGIDPLEVMDAYAEVAANEARKV